MNTKDLKKINKTLGNIMTPEQKLQAKVCHSEMRTILKKYEKELFASTYSAIETFRVTGAKKDNFNCMLAIVVNNFSDGYHTRKKEEKS